MKEILYIGMNPRTLDFSLPGFPEGLTAEKVEAGITDERASLKKAGYESTLHFVDTGVLDVSDLVHLLQSKKFDGILVGAGVRIPPSNFILFEKFINAIHEHAAGSKIIFNTSAFDSAESVKRWL